MNTIKHILLGLAAVATIGFAGCKDSQSIVDSKPAVSGAASTSAASATTTGNNHSAMFLAQLKTDLGLTDEQVTKVQAIMDKNHQDMQQAKSANANLSPEDFHKAFAEHRKNFESQLAAILTPAQQAKFASLQKDRMSKMKHPDPATLAARQEQHLAKLKADLSLTDAQVASIKALQETMRQQAQQDKAKMTDATSKESRHQLHAERFKTFQTQFEAILTPEQKVKFEQHKAQMRQQHGNGMFHGQPPMDK